MEIVYLIVGIIINHLMYMFAAIILVFFIWFVFRIFRFMNNVKLAFKRMEEIHNLHLKTPINKTHMAYMPDMEIEIKGQENWWEKL